MPYRLLQSGCFCSTETSSADAGVRLESTHCEGGPAYGKRVLKAFIREYLKDKNVFFMWTSCKVNGFISPAICFASEKPFMRCYLLLLTWDPKKLQVTYRYISWVFTFSLQVRYKWSALASWQSMLATHLMAKRMCAECHATVLYSLCVMRSCRDPLRLVLSLGHRTSVLFTFILKCCVGVLHYIKTCTNMQ